MGSKPDHSANRMGTSYFDYSIDVLRRHKSNIPLISLLAANTVPLWGVLFLGWDAFLIVLLYWAENLIIGLYNILKIAFVKMPHLRGHLAKLFVIPFFIIHYGGFVGVHGLFILFLFGKSHNLPLPVGNTWPCFLVFVQLLLGVIRQMWVIVPDGMLLPLAIFLASHGASFVHNFLIKGEYAHTNPEKLMSQPYSRIVVMHFAIIAGAFLAAAFKSPLPILIVLIALKTVLDIKLHLREHRLSFLRI